MLNDPRAAALGCLCQYSFDMGLTPCDPPADPRLAQDGYTLVGHICGIDEVFARDTAVCYGYVARAADGSFVVVTRGTFGSEEWYEDALGKPTGHPLAGQVESGFYTVFERFSYLPLGGTGRVPISDGIGRAVGSAPVVVVGHSLGGATATYLALDLAIELSPQQVSACFIASPKPGDLDFARFFDLWCPHYVSYAADDDIVPHLPQLGAAYVNLQKTVWFGNADRQAVIEPGAGAAHHVVSYCASLAYRLKDWTAWGGVRDADLVKIILGPAPGI